MDLSRHELLAPVTDVLDDDDDDFHRRQEEPEEQGRQAGDDEVLSDPVSSAYIRAMQEEADTYISDFFKGKEMWCGGPVPTDVLRSEKYIGLVLMTSLENALEAIHDVWPKRSPHAHGLASLDRSHRAAHIVSVQKQCKNAGIPKEWSGGITMMYYEFCEGFRFPPPAWIENL